MRQQIPFWCALGLAVFLGACKKEESPAPPTAAVRTNESRAPRQTEIRPAAEKLAANANANPGTNVVLKLKWQLGKRYVYRIDLDQHLTNHIPQMPKPMQQDVTMAMTYANNVVKETDNGGHELEMEFLANEMEMKMAGQAMMSFDSKEPAQNDAQNPMVAPFRKMIGSKVRLQVDANGKLEKVLNLEEWTSTLAGDQGPARGMIGQQFNEAFFRQMTDSALGLPNKPVAVGDTWPFQMQVPAGPMGKISVDAKITFQDWAERDNHRCVVLKSEGTITGSPGDAPGAMGAKLSVDHGKFDGTSWFDPELGALIDNETDQVMQIKGDVAAPPGANQRPASFTIDLGQKVSLKLVELANAQTKQ